MYRKIPVSYECVSSPLTGELLSFSADGSLTGADRTATHDREKKKKENMRCEEEEREYAVCTPCCTPTGAAYRVSRGEAEEWAVRIFTPHAAPCVAAGATSAATARSSRDLAKIWPRSAENWPRSGRDASEAEPSREGARCAKPRGREMCRGDAPGAAAAKALPLARTRRLRWHEIARDCTRWREMCRDVPRLGAPAPRGSAAGARFPAHRARAALGGAVAAAAARAVQR